MSNPIKMPPQCNIPLDEKQCEPIKGHVLEDPRIVKAILKNGVMNWDPMELVGKRVTKKGIEGEIVGYDYGSDCDLILEILKDNP